MNKTILLGRLTKKPEIRYSQTNNVKIALFSLAVNRRYVKENEERQTDFINIIAYSKLADFVEKYLDKGIQICISGRIQTRTYEDKNGQNRNVTEVIAEEIDFADSFKKQEPDESILNSSVPANTNNTQTENSENSDDFVFASDDLPF